jgi:hypothetical protein
MNETYGPKPSESFASYDPDTHSWRTSQVSFLTNTLAPYSETWPKQGTMRSGAVSRRRKSVPVTNANVSLSWPTPNTRDTRRGCDQKQLATEVDKTWQNPNWPTPDTMGARDGSQTRAAAYGNHAVSLHHKVAFWPTPDTSTSDYSDRWPSLQAPTTSTPGHECSPKCRRLNPLFVEWLQGFAIGHTALQPSEMP